jgi:hypothetical protein
LIAHLRDSLICPGRLDYCRGSKPIVQTETEFVLLSVEAPDEMNRSVDPVYDVEFVPTTELHETIHVEVYGIENICVDSIFQEILPHLDSMLQKGLAQGHHELIAAAIRRIEKGVPKTYGQPVRA